MFCVEACPEHGEAPAKSEALCASQISAVLLHPMDEELLYRILLHSNTSLYGNSELRLNVSIEGLARRASSAAALKCEHYSTLTPGKKVV